MYRLCLEKATDRVKIPLLPVLRRKKQADLHEVKASVLYRETAREREREGPCLLNQRKYKVVGNKVARWLSWQGGLLPKPDDPSSVPRTYVRVQGEKRFPRVILQPQHTHWAHTWAHTIIIIRASSVLPCNSGWPETGCVDQSSICGCLLSVEIKGVLHCACLLVI